MVVLGVADGRRQQLAGGVDRLPDLPAVDPPRHLLDQRGRQLLRSQLLVHAQEINLRDFHLFVVHVLLLVEFLSEVADVGSHSVLQLPGFVRE